VIDFKSQLRRQLRFLRASVEQFERGEHDEAVRIALSMRVMFHNSKSSTSLLSHLGLRKEIKLLDTFGPNEPSIPGAKLVLSMPMMLNMGGSDHGRIAAPLGISPERHRWLRFQNWWEQVVSVQVELSLTRREVVLCAADQDGGAHVDAKPGATTIALKKGFFKAGQSLRGKPHVWRDVPDYHFPLLRQFAYEVLNSPELTSIAER
jgi:hypothetical protein